MIESYTSDLFDRIYVYGINRRSYQFRTNRVFATSRLIFRTGVRACVSMRVCLCAHSEEDEDEAWGIGRDGRGGRRERRRGSRLEVDG